MIGCFLIRCFPVICFLIICFPVAVYVAEVVIDIFHNDACREILHRGVHDPVQPFDLRLVAQAFRNVMRERPITDLALITGDMIHRPFKSLYFRIVRHRMIGDEVGIVFLFRLFTSALPGIRAGHVSCQLVNLIRAEFPVALYPVVLPEQPVGKYQRTVFAGGKYALFGVVDGMCEGVDVIPVALYVRHVLYIAFQIVRTVGLFLPDAGLDLQVIDAAFVADAVACAILVGLPFVVLEPLGKHGLVFFHHQLTIAVDGDGLQFFGTEDIGIALIVEDAFIAGIFPPADLCCFLDGFQLAVCAFQLQFDVAPCSDVPVLA